jgi:hypothetical protein
MHAQAFELDGEQRQALADIVVKLPGDPAAFVFLRGNQTAPEVAQRRLGPLSVRHIDRRIDVAGDPAAETAPGHAGIEDPAVFAVLPAQPVSMLAGRP